MCYIKNCMDLTLEDDIKCTKWGSRIEAAFESDKNSSAIFCCVNMKNGPCDITIDPPLLANNVNTYYHLDM